MASNIQNINNSNYSDEKLYRSYHKDLANLRINDENINQNVKMRDKYFKLIEDYNISKTQSEKVINFYKDEINNESENLDMSEEDKAILRQEKRNDPTIDDSSESELLQKYNYHYELNKNFENILNNIDKDSKEYNDIQKVEELISKATNEENVIYYDFVDEISLSNSNLDNDISIQIDDENIYEATYNNTINNNNFSFDKYDFKQESLLNIKADEINTEKRIKSISEKYNVDIDTLNEQMSEIDSDPNEAEIFSLDPDYENKSYEEYKLDLIENNLKPTEHIENDISKDEVITDPFEDITNVAINKSNILEILENNTDIDFKEMDDNYEIYSMAFEKVNLESNNIDESLDEYISNRNIIDPTSYYSDTQKEIYKNLNSQEHQIMYKVMEEYGKLDPANFDPNNHFNELNDIENQVSNAKDLHSYAVNNFDNINNLNFNVGENNKLNLSVFTNDKEVYLTKDNNNEIIQNENSKIQRLKSVELEKNVISLLPKDQQENNYKETLSRLDINKSTLKDDLKSYMSNTKIDNVINSVKQHFENVKVKAEDIHQTFKDLGQWNTENKFVKNIDNVVNSVKELGKKHESELLQSDSKSIMTKLNSEYLELKDYINKAEQDNNSYETQNSIRNQFVNQMLDSKQIKIDFDPKDITKDLPNNQKLELYNQLKDMNHHYKNKADTSSMIKEQQNNIITKQLETDNPEFKEYRKEHVNLKQSLNPIKLDTSNEKLDDIIKNTNKDISKMDRLHKKGFKENRNQEAKITNQNNQAKKIKSNDMFKKMDKLQEQSQVQNNSHNNDLEQKKKPKLTR